MTNFSSHTKCMEFQNQPNFLWFIVIFPIIVETILKKFLKAWNLKNFMICSAQNRQNGHLHPFDSGPLIYYILCSYTYCENNYHYCCKFRSLNFMIVWTTWIIPGYVKLLCYNNVKEYINTYDWKPDVNFFVFRGFNFFW